MQELGIPGRLEKYMTLSMNNELSSSLYSLVKNLSKGDFKYFNQEFGNTITSIWVILKGLKKNCLAKKTFLIPLPIKKLVTKNVNMFLMFGIILKWKRWKIITTCT